MSSPFDPPPGALSALEAQEPLIRQCSECGQWDDHKMEDESWRCVSCGHVDRPEPVELPSPDNVRIGKFQASPHPTALQGAVKVYPRSGTQRRLILDAIARAGDRGLTHDEIAEVPGVANTAHRTRKTELVEDGWVEDSGRVRQTATGTDAVVWVLTEQGRRSWTAAA